MKKLKIPGPLQILLLTAVGIFLLLVGHCAFGQQVNFVFENSKAKQISKKFNLYNYSPYIDQDYSFKKTSEQYTLHTRTFRNGNSIIIFVSDTSLLRYSFEDLNSNKSIVKGFFLKHKKNYYGNFQSYEDSCVIFPGDEFYLKKSSSSNYGILFEFQYFLDSYSTSEFSNFIVLKDFFNNMKRPIRDNEFSVGEVLIE